MSGLIINPYAFNGDKPIAVPVVEGTSVYVGDTLPTSHTVPLPSGVTADELLLVFFRTNNNTVTTLTTGWTRLFQFADGGSTEAWYQIADGSETSLVIATGSGRLTANSYRISGASQIEGNIANSLTTQPPSLAPTWGLKESLWITVCSINSRYYTFTAPANYGDKISGTATWTTGKCVGSARRVLEASSEQPGAWIIGGGTPSFPHAATVALKG